MSTSPAIAEHRNEPGTPSGASSHRMFGRRRSARPGRAVRWSERLRIVLDPASGLNSGPDVAVYRRRMLDTVAGFAPLSLVAASMSCIVLVTLLWNFPDHDRLMFWLFACLACVVIGLALHRRVGRNRSLDPVRAGYLVIGHAILLATTWGVLPWLLGDELSGNNQMLISAVSSGVMCLGAFALAAVPVAAAAFATIIGLANTIELMLSSEPMSNSLGTLMFLYLALVLAMVLNLAETHSARTREEIGALHQNELIGLLLKDFQEHTSDILWEIDADGFMVDPSPQLCSALRLNPAKAHRVTFVDRMRRFSAPGSEQRRSIDRLAQEMDKAAPFRDVAVSLEIEERTVWWSMTAKPVWAPGMQRSGWRGVLSDISDERSSHGALMKLAHMCSLTGLLNRHRFIELLEDELKKCDRAEGDTFGGPCNAVLLLDLDDFKRVNDTLGHSGGDELLRELARRLKANLRPGDVAARLGGDEFAVLLHDVINEEDAVRYGKRLIARAQEPLSIEGVQIPINMSVGVALAPRDGRRPESLMHSADLALYAAKGDGKGVVRVYSHALGHLSRRRRLIEKGLRSSIRDGGIFLMFQPQVDFRARRVIAFEALARWVHPELGPIQPSEFIPVAEETGLINQLGQWVLLESCRAAAQWPEHVSVAVNVSVAQAIDERLVNEVREALSATGLPSRRLEIEITESVLLNDDPNTTKALHALRALGVRIALDDFGVGYSSLAYLRRFPFDSLKIDRAFTSEITGNIQARSIVRAILDMAGCMGMTTIAEGIEVVDQARLLSTDGCDVLQGYLFSKPVPVSEVPRFIERWSGDSDSPPTLVDVPPDTVPAGGDTQAGPHFQIGPHSQVGLPTEPGAHARSPSIPASPETRPVESRRRRTRHGSGATVIRRPESEPLMDSKS